MPPNRRRLSGVAAIEDALAQGTPIARLLVREDDEALAGLVASATERGVEVVAEPPREMQRMTEGDRIERAIALVGPPPEKTLAAVMTGPGLALHLCRLRYPGNVGFILRAAEVAGAAGVALDVEWAEKEHAAARRVSIHAERFLPVVEAETARVFQAARAAGRWIVAVETSGETTPWSLDLTRPTLIVVGGEAEGIPAVRLAEADETVRIPTRGFIPSYNVQAAASMLLGEWLRQTESFA